MAAGGYKTFTAGDVLTAADTNDYLMQGVLVFGGTAARASAIPSPVEGQVTFRTDDDALEFYDGSDWQAIGGDVPSATVSSPAATGQYTDAGITYDYYTFTASGTLTVDTAGFADVLVVGGGASGGCGAGGGGGAGGHLYITDAYLPVGTATVTVGAGGAALSGTGSSYNEPGRPGIASRLGDFYSPGGGGGGSYLFGASNALKNLPGRAGGSGGGGSHNLAGGAGASGIGNDGGAGGSSSAGGGGGANAAGSAGSGSTGGAGGAGVANSITGTSVTRAGGGGGGASSSGAGGSGGGGAGASSGTATSGTANTGGGGGGMDSSTNNTSGAGGSGVVIVRVKV